MLAAALWRDIYDASFDDLKKRLLYPFTAYVARDAAVFAHSRDLIDLVYEYDTALRLLYVAVGSLQKAGEDVFYVLADVARFR